MSEITKVVPTEKMKEVSIEVGKALGDAIRKHPKESLGIGLALGGLYILKDKKIKLKFKRGDLDFEFETE
ncbi:hypothetical protein [Virgibacillus sp. CBA3643]|uniref:hypothetical protein n=1 Tax=Virgibacillus sp. CBA3643 TaxID=2942278 RepID=UPI0035A26F0A